MQRRKASELGAKIQEEETIAQTVDVVTNTVRQKLHQPRRQPLLGLVDAAARREVLGARTPQNFRHAIQSILH
jgi:hypothetical protein